MSYKRIDELKIGSSYQFANSFYGFSDYIAISKQEDIYICDYCKSCKYHIYEYSIKVDEESQYQVYKTKNPIRLAVSCLKCKQSKELYYFDSIYKIALKKIIVKV